MKEKKRRRRKEEKKGEKSISSWESAFASASSIQPADGIDELMKQSSYSQVDPGLAKISKLAATIPCSVATNDDREGRERPAANNNDNTHKRRRSDSDLSDRIEPEEEVPVTLEGKMVPHPRQSAQLMILVDPVSKVVFSATERTPSGDMLRLGRISTKNTEEIDWDETAFAPTDEGKLLLTVAFLLLSMYRSRPVPLFRGVLSVKYHARLQS